MTTIKRFDIAKHLKTDEEIVAFLIESAQSGNASDFVHAVGTAARAKGMTEVARQTGLTRASLYKSFADGGNPQFDTVLKVCSLFGVKLMPALSTKKRARSQSQAAMHEIA